MQVQPLEGSHTGEYFAKVYKMLHAWEIKDNRLHLVIRDDAANMIKAMKDVDLPSFGCLGHTLQLIVNDGILLQARVSELLVTCKKIVRYFKHSTLAYHNLSETQKQPSLTQHRLQQDVKTR